MAFVYGCCVSIAFFLGYAVARITEYLPRYEVLYRDALWEVSFQRRELEELRQLVKGENLGPYRGEGGRHGTHLHDHVSQRPLATRYPRGSHGLRRH